MAGAGYDRSIGLAQLLRWPNGVDGQVAPGDLTISRAQHTTRWPDCGASGAVVAVNKMDLVDYDEAVFNAIVEDFASFASKLVAELIKALRDAGVVPPS